MTFTRYEVSETHLDFFKRVDFEVSYLKFGKSLGRKVHFFFKSLGTTEVSGSFRLSLYIDIFLLINIPEQFQLCFFFKYSRSYKLTFCNVGNKSFETEFSFRSFNITRVT